MGCNKSKVQVSPSTDEDEENDVENNCRDEEEVLEVVIDKNNVYEYGDGNENEISEKYKAVKKSELYLQIVECTDKGDYEAFKNNNDVTNTADKTEMNTDGSSQIQDQHNGTISNSSLNETSLKYESICSRPTSHGSSCHNFIVKPLLLETEEAENENNAGVRVGIPQDEKGSNSSIKNMDVQFFHDISNATSTTGENKHFIGTSCCPSLAKLIKSHQNVSNWLQTLPPQNNWKSVSDTEDDEEVEFINNCHNNTVIPMKTMNMNEIANTKHEKDEPKSSQTLKTQMKLDNEKDTSLLIKDDKENVNTLFVSNCPSIDPPNIYCEVGIENDSPTKQDFIEIEECLNVEPNLVSPAEELCSNEQIESSKSNHGGLDEIEEVVTTLTGDDSSESHTLQIEDQSIHNSDFNSNKIAPKTLDFEDTRMPTFIITCPASQPKKRSKMSVLKSKPTTKAQKSSLSCKSQLKQDLSKGDFEFQNVDDGYPTAAVSNSLKRSASFTVPPVTTPVPETSALHNNNSPNSSNSSIDAKTLEDLIQIFESHNNDKQSSTFMNSLSPPGFKHNNNNENELQDVSNFFKDIDGIGIGIMEEEFIQLYSSSSSTSSTVN